MLMQHTGGGEQAGGMAVMTAGMAQAGIPAGKREAGFLGDGQRIHIRTEQNGLAGLSANNRCQNAGFQAAGPPFDAVLGQFFLDLLTGFKFLFTDFGMGMEPAAHLNQIRLIFLGNFLNIHGTLLTAGLQRNRQ